MDGRTQVPFSDLGLNDVYWGVQVDDQVRLQQLGQEHLSQLQRGQDQGQGQGQG